MIVKRSTRGADKPSSFGRLVRYIVRSDTPDKPAPAGAWTVNCGVDDVALASRVVEATQALNTRCRADKTYHLIVSFAEGDEVDLSDMKRIEARLAASIGYADHQRVCALHTDTDNPHLHVAINRIHPLTRRAVMPRLDFRTLSREAAAIERDFGLALTHASPARGPQLPERAAQMQAHSGQQSFAAWLGSRLAETGADFPSSCRSWQDVHAGLARFGARLERRGAGLVVVNDRGDRCKASQAHRGLSHRALSGRLGDFEAPGPSLPSAGSGGSYQAEPVRSAEAQSPLWKDYGAARRRAAANRSKRFAEARTGRSESLAQAKLAWAKQRDLINSDRSLSRSARWRAFDLLAKERRRWLASAVADRKVAAGAIRADNPLPTWRQWLTDRARSGDAEAFKLLSARQPGRPALASEALPPAVCDWIEKRNASRALNLREPVPEHRPFSAESAGIGAFRGVRRIAEHHVALIQLRGVVHVVPASERQAARLAKRRRIGDPVRVDRAGRFSMAQERSR